MRLTGLESKRCKEPGSNICGMIGAVTTMATSTATIPTIQLRKSESTISSMNFCTDDCWHRHGRRLPDQVRSRERLLRPRQELVGKRRFQQHAIQPQPLVVGERCRTPCRRTPAPSSSSARPSKRPPNRDPSLPAVRSVRLTSCAAPGENRRCPNRPCRAPRGLSPARCVSSRRRATRRAWRRRLAGFVRSREQLARRPAGRASRQRELRGELLLVTQRRDEPRRIA